MTNTIKKLAAIAVMTAGVGAMTVATATPAAAWYRGGFRGGYGYHGYGFHGGFGPRYGYRYGYGPRVGLGIAAGALAAGALAGAVAAPYYYGAPAPYGYYQSPYAYRGYGYGPAINRQNASIPACKAPSVRADGAFACLVL